MSAWSFRVVKWLALLVAVLATEVGTCRAQTIRPDVVSSDAQDRLTAWQQLVRNRQQGTWNMLVAVNNFFNQFAQQDDAMTWGVDDYWATVAELLLVGAGDCEDFAGAKYTTLIAMGVPPDRMHLAVTLAFSPRTRRIERHMVLIYEDAVAGVRWVLDNLSAQIASQSSRVDLAVLGTIDFRSATKTALHK